LIYTGTWHNSSSHELCHSSYWSPSRGTR